MGGFSAARQLLDVFNHLLDAVREMNADFVLGYLGVAVAIGTLTILAMLMIRDAEQARIEKERARIEKERAYRQALLEFRWRDDMTPVEFERHCADYLSLHGWRARTTKGSGDEGIDVVATKRGHTLVLQCKLHSKPIGTRAVQEAFTAQAVAEADTAAVVSNQRYTPAARQLAAKTGVLLLHFTDLKDLDRRLGLSDRQEAEAPERA